MKKMILSVLAALALAVGGLAAASPAQAAGNFTINASSSNCNVQYKNFSGTVRTLPPGFASFDSVWMVRVPSGCHGSIGLAYQPHYILTGGVWKSFPSMFPSGTATTTYSYQN